MPPERLQCQSAPQGAILAQAKIDFNAIYQVVFNFATQIVTDIVTPKITAKIGYKKTDTDFKLFVYNPTSTSKFYYVYLLSLPLQNNMQGYDYGSVQCMYNKTINTFGMGEDKNILEAPTDIIEISTVNSTVISNINSVLSNKDYLTDTSLTSKAEPWTFILEDGSSVTKKVVLA